MDRKHAISQQSTPRCATPSFQIVRLRALCFHAITEQECIAHIIASLDESKGGWVVTPNVDILRRCEKSPELRALIDRADLVVADGMPLIWASRLQGRALPERVTGSNLLLSLSEAAATSGRSIYLLGGDPGTAERAAQTLCERYPDTVVAGVYCPRFGFENDPEELKKIKALLLEASPDIVYVAMGFPKQEYLIREFRNVLPHAWWLGIGISFSFVAGRIRRAPQWIQQMGFEWLHRLFQEPRRLGRRYLVDGIPFAMCLFGSAFRCRLSNGRHTTVGER